MMALDLRLVDRLLWLFLVGGAVTPTYEILGLLSISSEICRNTGIVMPLIFRTSVKTVWNDISRHTSESISTRSKLQSRHRALQRRVKSAAYVLDLSWLANRWWFNRLWNQIVGHIDDRKVWLNIFVLFLGKQFRNANLNLVWSFPLWPSTGLRKVLISRFVLCLQDLAIILFLLPLCIFWSSFVRLTRTFWSIELVLRIIWRLLRNLKSVGRVFSAWFFHRLVYFGDTVCLMRRLAYILLIGFQHDLIIRNHHYGSGHWDVLRRAYSQISPIRRRKLKDSGSGLLCKLRKLRPTRLLDRHVNLFLREKLCKAGGCVLNLAHGSQETLLRAT